MQMSGSSRARQRMYGAFEAVKGMGFAALEAWNVLS
jgi:hypothetical protein